jgi:geranylgeranyl reductase family protein
LSGSQPDVVVVGAGPAGSATAALLARRGIDVLLIEKAAFPREKACGEYLSPGVVAALDRIGVLPDVLQLEHARPLGMRIKTTTTEHLVRYDQGDGHIRALSIQRPIFDQVLRDHAIRSGARLEERARVTGAHLNGDNVSGVCIRRGTDDEVISARFVVAADGLHSTVSRSLGLDLPVHWPRRLGLIARYQLPENYCQGASMYVGDQVYCALNPVGRSIMNVGLVSHANAKRTGESTAAYFDRRLAELPEAHGVLTHGERCTPIRGMGPLARRVRRTSGRGYLLVGDAAGFFDPFTGEGVYRALRGAEIAASAIEESLTRGIDVPLRYNERRREAFNRKQQFCMLIQLFLRSPAVFQYVTHRLSTRPDTSNVVSEVIGDLRPAGDALTPRQLLALFRP